MREKEKNSLYDLAMEQKPIKKESSTFTYYDKLMQQMDK